METHSKIASAFRTALAEALDALPKPSVGADRFLTADEFARYFAPGSESGRAYRAIGDDLLEVIMEIQRFREKHPGPDQFFRQRGIVTRAREVRA
jgi:hypothetical protein